MRFTKRMKSIMKNKKNLSIVFRAITFLLSNLMCATVAYNYCNMLWSIKYEGASAPASVAFLRAIPYLIGIILSGGFAIFFQKQYKKMSDS